MFKLKEGRDYEEKASGRRSSITDVHGEDGTFIGYRWDDEPEIRWLTADEFRKDFIPLSSITLEERCHVLGSTVADINEILKRSTTSDYVLKKALMKVIENCVQELRTDG